jgi:DHA2 family multidrug resistance protein
MTTLIAPIMGPILGGILCDQVSWPWIFWINVPITMLCGYAGWQLLKSQESLREKIRVDAVGLGLLVVWVAACRSCWMKARTWTGSIPPRSWPWR